MKKNIYIYIYIYPIDGYMDRAAAQGPVFVYVSGYVYMYICMYIRMQFYVCIYVYV